MFKKIFQEINISEMQQIFKNRMESWWKDHINQEVCLNCFLSVEYAINRVSDTGTGNIYS